MKLASINSHVWWNYEEVVNNPMNLPQIKTSCMIESASGSVRSASVTTYSGDTFSKEQGRKLSLKKCIENFPREIRALIWNEYHSRSGVNPYIKKEEKKEEVPV